MAVSCALNHHQHLRCRPPVWGSAGKQARADRNTSSISPIKSPIFSATTPSNSASSKSSSISTIHRLANTNGTVTFSTLENFLTGTSTGPDSILTGDNNDHYREHWHAAFVQDTWRITRRVTLTPGLRWEYVGSPHSTVNHLGTFDPSQPGGVVQVGPGLPDLHPDTPGKDKLSTPRRCRLGHVWQRQDGAARGLRHDVQPHGHIGNHWRPNSVWSDDVQRAHRQSRPTGARAARLATSWSIDSARR